MTLLKLKYILFKNVYKNKEYIPRNNQLKNNQLKRNEKVFKDKKCL